MTLCAFKALKPLAGADVLTAADVNAEKIMARLTNYEIVLVDIKPRRNVKHHRLFFAMLSKVHDNLDRRISMDALKDIAVIGAGHVEAVKTRHGIVQLPKSISFASMDQDEFSEFFERAVDFLCNEVCLNMKAEQLRDELLEMANG